MPAYYYPSARTRFIFGIPARASGSMVILRHDISLHYYDRMNAFIADTFPRAAFAFASVAGFAQLPSFRPSRVLRSMFFRNRRSCLLLLISHDSLRLQTYAFSFPQPAIRFNTTADLC